METISVAPEGFVVFQVMGVISYDNTPPTDPPIGAAGNSVLLSPRLE